VLPVTDTTSDAAATAISFVVCSANQQSEYYPLHNIPRYLKNKLYVIIMFNEIYLKPTWFVSPLTPNGHYSGRTAPLTHRHCILNIYSTNIVLNILNMLHNPRFSLFKMPFLS
jgi:hypothetical protein